MGAEAWFKPPMTIFVVWGCFVLCFLLCGTSKRLCGFFFCYDCDDEPSGYDEETYEHLSSRRRRELDDLRSVAILRFLGRFTLTLKRENMMKRLPDGNSQHSDEEEGISANIISAGGNSSGDEGGDRKTLTGLEMGVSDRNSLSGNSQHWNEKEGISIDGGEHDSSSDVETGDSCRSTNTDDYAAGDEGSFDDKNSTDDDKSEDDDRQFEEGEFTHILIPHPGYDDDGLRVTRLEDYDYGNKKGVRNVARRLFFRKAREREGTTEATNESKDKREGDKAKTSDELDPKETEDGTTERRPVPIFCAVCLMEYSVSDRVCWSSNAECTHAFHEDCMLQWLISLGRKRSRGRGYGRNPTDRRLLDYELECPCCRQDFVSKNLITGKD